MRSGLGRDRSGQAAGCLLHWFACTESHSCSWVELITNRLHVAGHKGFIWGGVTHNDSSSIWGGFVGPELLLLLCLLCAGHQECA